MIYKATNVVENTVPGVSSGVTVMMVVAVTIDRDGVTTTTVVLIGSCEEEDVSAAAAGTELTDEVVVVTAFAAT